MKMTEKKFHLVLDRYAKRVEDLLSKDTWSENAQLLHLKEMIPKTKNFLNTGKFDKANRWLGFIQGVFYSNGIYSIDEMADHNRVTKKDIKDLYPYHTFDKFGCNRCGGNDASKAAPCQHWREYEDAPNG